MRDVRLRFSIDRGPWQRSHLSLVFCECLQVIIHKGDTNLAYEISPIHRESRVRWMKRLPLGSVNARATVALAMAGFRQP